MSKPLELKAELKFNAKSFPMVGWHDPFAKVTYKEREWEIAIAGGCRAITVSDSGGHWTVSIEELLPQILDAIEERKVK